MNLRLSNKLGESVEIPISIASELFTLVSGVDFIASTTEKQVQSNCTSLGSETSEGPEEVSAPLQLNDLDYSIKVLEKVVYYAKLPDDERTANIPKPLNVRLSEILKEKELNLVKEAEQEQLLVQLLDLASYLRYKQLVVLCAAYMSERIDEISRGAPDIMTGSERIREFLHMDNEWTPEEMENLRREMEYVKQVDPNAY